MGIVQHILSLTGVRKVCYSLAEIYVKSVYLNLFGWRVAVAIKVREPLIYADVSRVRRANKVL
jgi:hypothetical protein